MSNGLRVILAERHSFPIVSVWVTYLTGSADESPGQYGIAHLVEHLMFHGSARFARGEHTKIVKSSGGVLNASTGADRTVFYETVPSLSLAAILALEADRMGTLRITNEALDLERSIVKQERRLKRDKNAYAQSRDVLLSTAYDLPAYGHDGLGNENAIDSLTVDDALNFYKRQYRPSNAILTVVGDFKEAEALAQVKLAFDALEDMPTDRSKRILESAHDKERRATVVDKSIRLQKIDFAFLLPVGDTQDWFAAYIGFWALANGPKSWLYTSMVDQAHIATNITFATQHRRGTPLGVISVLFPNSVVPEDVELAFNKEIASFSEAKVPASLLASIRRTVRLDSAMQMQSVSGCADLLSQYAAFYDDPNLSNTFEIKLSSLDSETVRKVMGRALMRSNRTVVVTQREESSGPKTAGAR